MNLVEFSECEDKYALKKGVVLEVYVINQEKPELQEDESNCCETCHFLCAKANVLAEIHQRCPKHDDLTRHHWCPLEHHRILAAELVHRLSNIEQNNYYYPQPSWLANWLIYWLIDYGWDGRVY